MTSWLESQKCILTKENSKRRRFRLRNEADKTSDPIQSNQWMNPIHVQLWVKSSATDSSHDSSPWLNPSID